MIKFNVLRLGDRFFLDDVQYRTLQLKRSDVTGMTNAQNVATGVKRYVLPNMDVEPVTESYLHRITPIQCRYEPNIR